MLMTGGKEKLRMANLENQLASLQMSDKEISQAESEIVASNSAEEVCGETCQEEIVAKVVEKLKPTVARSVVPVPTKVAVDSVQYVPLGGGGSSKEMTWVSMATTQTQIDWSRYAGKKKVTWEAYARVLHGNGKVMLRLYDLTNQIAVPGSDLETGSETTVYLKSGDLAVWAGTNTYVVQVNSLTGYEAFYEGGKLKVEL